MLLLLMVMYKNYFLMAQKYMLTQKIGTNLYNCFLKQNAMNSINR